MNYSNNPKALNLDAVRGTDKKVTLGFRCTPQLKLTLAEDADKYGISLSEYVEQLMIKNVEPLHHEKAVKEELMLTIDKLKNVIAFYENDVLKRLLKDNMNETVVFVNSKKEKIRLKIQSIHDVYTIVVNSFQSVKP